MMGDCNIFHKWCKKVDHPGIYWTHPDRLKESAVPASVGDLFTAEGKIGAYEAGKRHVVCVDE